MRKHIIPLILATILLFSLPGCGRKNKNTDTTSSDPVPLSSFLDTWYVNGDLSNEALELTEDGSWIYYLDGEVFTSNLYEMPEDTDAVTEITLTYDTGIEDIGAVVAGIVTITSNDTLVFTASEDVELFDDGVELYRESASTGEVKTLEIEDELPEDAYSEDEEIAEYTEDADEDGGEDDTEAEDETEAAEESTTSRVSNYYYDFESKSLKEFKSDDEEEEVVEDEDKTDEEGEETDTEETDG